MEQYKVQGYSRIHAPADLTIFIQRLMKALITTLSDIELCIDRAHLFPKPMFLPDTAPRGTLVRIHYFHVEDKIRWYLINSS